MFPATSVRANAFSDVIEMGANTRQTGLTIRLRGRTLPTVTFVSRRAWCHESGPPRSREAFGSNPSPPTKTNLQILSHEVCLRMRANGTCSAVQIGGVVGLKAGVAVIKEHCQSLGGTRTKVTHRVTNRVKSSTGSFNARWRREPPGGNTEEPETDNLRGSAQTADREKLNDERGIKPLPVNRSRDGAGSGNA